VIEKISRFHSIASGKNGLQSIRLMTSVSREKCETETAAWVPLNRRDMLAFQDAPTHLCCDQQFSNE
jgi:hypothetical protein